MTASQLAEATGVTAGAVSQWLSGQKHPRRETAEAIASAVDADLAWLEHGRAGTVSGPGSGRVEYLARAGWRFRPLPSDRGMDFGNANIWVFDPTPETFTREIFQNVLDVVRGHGASVSVRLIQLTGEHLSAFLSALRWNELEPHLRESAAAGQKFGRSISRGLTRLEETKELLLLRVEEHGTLGLVGDEFGAGSNFTALCRNNLDSEKSKLRGRRCFRPRQGGSVAVVVAFHCSVQLGPCRGAREGKRGVSIGRTELSYDELDSEETFAGPGWFGEVLGDHTESYWETMPSQRTSASRDTDVWDVDADCGLP